MIKRGYRSDINDKIDTILALCSSLNLIFDNTYANHYKLIVKEQEYEFLTYDDVISALRLMKEMINND